MPKLSGIFDYFPEISSLSAENLIDDFLSTRSGDHKILQNQLYNRVLYPQTIPVSVSDEMFDLALLRESLQRNPGKYYDHNFKKIYIPEKLLERFPDLPKLVWIFLDIFSGPGLTKIYLKSESLGSKNLGTLIKPQLLSKTDWVYLWLDGKKYQVKIGDSITIPLESKRVDLRFSCTGAKLLGKNDLTAEVAGGAFGIAFDARF